LVLQSKFKFNAIVNEARKSEKRSANSNFKPILDFKSRQLSQKSMEEVLNSKFSEDKNKLGLETDLIRIMADITKMKRRCKHILDVTDQVK